MRYAAMAISAAVLAGCGPHERAGEMRRETSAIEMDQSELTRVDLKMGAGELRVNGGAAKLMDADFEYNIASWKPEVSFRSTGVRSDLEIKQPSSTGFPIGETRYRWDIRLNDGRLMDVIAHMGAGEAKMNLGSLALRTVELDIGAGEVEIDLRGAPKRSYDVRVNGGVGQATVYLPDRVGIMATASGGIGEINVDGLESRNGRWIRPQEENNPVVVRVDVKGGVGEIRIVAN